MEDRRGLAAYQCTTIRLKLKIGARIRITVRTVWLSFSESCPLADDFSQKLANLRRYPAWPPPPKPRRLLLFDRPSCATVIG
jgi:hypothetical protein